MSVKFCIIPLSWPSQVAQLIKNLLTNAGDARDVSSIPGSKDSPGEGSGNLLQYSCLRNQIPWTEGPVGYNQRVMKSQRVKGSWRARYDWAHTHASNLYKPKAIISLSNSQFYVQNIWKTEQNFKIKLNTKAIE